MLNQDNIPLLEGITQLIETKPAYFRIPGHRLERGISTKWTDKVGTRIFAYDVTETPLTDDLHSPEGVICEAQELLAQLYQADKSFFLVNGSTCGNEAMIISAALEGQEIMIARNAHKSAMMGLIISGAKPVYVMPDILEEWGLQGGISGAAARKTFANHPNCKALFLVSPSYYGITSDLEELAQICHEYGAMLLVDEAHGGHVYFHPKFPKGALEQGADMCVQSMHKVTGALTQSSVLHIKSRLADQERVASNLGLVQSTSPSYLLMTSLDCARYELARHGEQMMQEAYGLARQVRKRINHIFGFTCMGGEEVGKASIADIDLTRLVISAKKIGLTGFELEERLFQEYAVNMELADYENVVAVITYANTKTDLDRLVQACEEISRKERIKTEDSWKRREQESFPHLPEQVLTPRQAYFARKQDIPWTKAVGEIAGEMIAPYPPGIPVLYPGERISMEIWEYLDRFRRDKRHIHGSKEGKLQAIKVIKEV